MFQFLIVGFQPRKEFIYNPITGRKMVKTWMADKLFSGLEAYYLELEHTLGTQFLFPKPIYRPFLSTEEQNDWQGKAVNGDFDFVKEVRGISVDIEGLQDPFGGILLKNTGYVDVPSLIGSYGDFLREKGKLLNGVFKHEDLIFSEGLVKYGDISASKVIFCEGASATGNAFWDFLPFRPVKGEILEIDVNFPSELIVNRHVFVVPRRKRFMVGSTYDHQQLDYESSEAGIRSIENRLKKILSVNYTIKNSWAGVRPSTFDRRPFIGLHPEYRQLGIFNGFGTKGVSLIPFFAVEYVNFLIGGQPLTPEGNIDRVLR